MITNTAAAAAKADNRIDLAGVLIESKIPNATPVFRAYVMLKKPSITVTELLRPSLDWMRSLLHRSSATIITTTSRYGRRPLISDAIWRKV